LSDLRRREFIALVGGVAAAWRSVAEAQTRKKRPLIGTFGSGTPTQRKGLPLWPLFLNGLRELGYIEGRDFDIIFQLAASTDELPKVAEELVQLKPDVILAAGAPMRLPPNGQLQRFRSLLQRREIPPRLVCRKMIFAVQVGT
jgi:putative ABC transport system substrate-binding protein